MMTSVIEARLYHRYRFGTHDGISLSNLQFVDDTLILGVKSWANVRYMRAVLILFEQVSGLKVNFHKKHAHGD